MWDHLRPYGKTAQATISYLWRTFLSFYGDEGIQDGLAKDWEDNRPDRTDYLPPCHSLRQLLLAVWAPRKMDLMEDGRP